ncbi:hypothetical protein XYCOK13_36690 [Xylanibacillus composti]|uniref:Uncharacterized protein n=2 Tax=Xylanibacillus composti TaxID=1572762 RepID=A0A8J4M3G0_9BACL|nr:hypothetical protein XYCOK13_36690 [Xylanibacillus composti]
MEQLFAICAFDELIVWDNSCLSFRLAGLTSLLSEMEMEWNLKAFVRAEYPA